LEKYEKDVFQLADTRCRRPEKVDLKRHPAKKNRLLIGRITNKQCWGSLTFWLRIQTRGLTNLDPAPNPDRGLFFSDFKDAQKNFHIFFLQLTLSLVLNFFLLKFCAKILFCNHYFSLLNTFMRKGKDLDPDL
jgi:hypothetical protein